MLANIAGILLNSVIFSAAAVAALSSVPLTLIFSTVVLAFVTLRNGLVFGANVLFLSLVFKMITVVLSMIFNAASVTDISLLAVVPWQFLLMASVIVLAAGTLSITIDLQLAIWLIFCSALLICGYYLTSGHVPSTFVTALTAELQQLNDGMNVQQIDQILMDANLAHYFMQAIYGTSVAISIFLWSLISLLLARKWQAMLFNAGGFQQEWHNVRWPRSLVIIFLVLFLLISLVNLPWKLSLPILAVLILCSLMLVVSATSLIHWLVAYKRMSVINLILFYLLWLLPWFLVLGSIVLVLLSICDSWLDIRARLRYAQK